MEELALILSYRGKCISWPKGCFNLYNGNTIAFYDLAEMSTAYYYLQRDCKLQAFDFRTLVVHHGDAAVAYYYKTFLAIDKDLAFQFKLGVCRYMNWNESYFETIIV